MSQKTIYIQTAMADYDDMFNADGTPKVVSLKFVKKNGEIKFVSQGIKCGSSTKRMGLLNLKAIQPVIIEHTGRVKKVGNPVQFKWYTVIYYKSNIIQGPTKL